MYVELLGFSWIHLLGIQTSSLETRAGLIPLKDFFLPSAQGASLVPAPSPSGERRRPSGSNCASNGQAPGELPEFQVCDPGVLARPHLQGSGPFWGCTCGLLLNCFPGAGLVPEFMDCIYLELVLLFMCSSFLLSLHPFGHQVPTSVLLVTLWWPWPLSLGMSGEVKACHSRSCRVGVPICVTHALVELERCSTQPESPVPEHHAGKLATAWPHCNDSAPNNLESALFAVFLFF